MAEIKRQLIDISSVSCYLYFSEVLFYSFGGDTGPPHNQTSNFPQLGFLVSFLEGIPYAIFSGVIKLPILGG